MPWITLGGPANRAKSEDFDEKVGIDQYRYEAYRRRMDRSVVRFEWRQQDSHCAVLIHRNKDIDHPTTINTVWTVLKNMKIISTPFKRLSLTQAVKSASKKKGTKSARLEADGGFVDLVSTLAIGGIDEVAAVRHARHAMNEKEFARAQGIFLLGEEESLAQPISVQVFGSEGRIRLWAQCRRDDVHSIIGFILKQNSGDHDV